MSDVADQVHDGRREWPEPDRPALRTAVSLMRMALALLDRADDGAGAARLQHAIDTVLGIPPLRPDGSDVNDLRRPAEVDPDA